MQNETGGLNNPITTKDTEFIVKAFWKINLQAQIASTGEFYQILKGEKTTSSTQSLPKTEEWGTSLNPFYKIRITLIQKPDKDGTPKKPQTNFAQEQTQKFSTISKWNSATYKKNTKAQPSGIFSAMQHQFIFFLKINVIYHINNQKKKNHIFLLIDMDKTFDKTTPTYD